MEFEKTGKSYEEFSRIMEDIAALGYENFIDRMDTGKVEVIPIFHRSDNPAESIQSVAKAEAISRNLPEIKNKALKKLMIFSDSKAFKNIHAKLLLLVEVN